MQSFLSEIYRFSVPLTKSHETTERGEKLYVMEGIASDETDDQQGEVLIQKGMDFDPLMRGGVINWDHQKGPENVIGEPIVAEIQNGPRFYVKGHLYVDDMPQAAAAWNLAKAMEKSGKRSLGWSVEGAVLGRLGRQIVRSEVRHLALTHQPVNANTFASIAKSMTTGNTQALQLENLDHQITSVLWGDCSDDQQKCYGDTGYFYRGRTGMHQHLTTCKGMDATSAAGIIKRLLDSGI